MKRPLLDLEQRQAIYNETLYGAELEFKLAYQHVRREAIKNKGIIFWIKFRKDILNLINLRLFGK